jgi:endonuclease/exonuclease/phosphatase (EEP) superfamily protein YafD
MQSMMRLFLVLALVAGGLMTVAGALAPVYPIADLPNHFRPYTLAGACALLAGALMLRAPRTAWASAGLVGLNGALLALPLLWSAEPAERSTAGQALAAAAERDLAVVTFNMRYGDPRRVARALRAGDADIVLLQEIGAREVRALRPLLQARYPHSHTCAQDRRCDAAVFAKRPWAASGYEPWTRSTPEMIWVELDDPEVGRVRVVGVHLSLPFRPDDQVRHVERLVRLRASYKGRMIIAGDFNMTPWSWRLQRLLVRADMRRHATFLRSWPTDRQFGAPFPAFLIDHVMTTPDIKSVSIRIGPNLGSDHLPVIAVLRLPPARERETARP